MLESDASNQNIAFILQKNESDGPYYHQEWQGMPQTKPIIPTVGGLPRLQDVAHVRHQLDWPLVTKWAA